MEQEIEVYNDFRSRHVAGGREYLMELDDGYAKVTNFVFDRGFVINYFDIATSFFSNQDHIGSMNYLMLNTCLLGRFVCRLDDGCVRRRAEMAYVHHPSNDRNYIHIPTGRYMGLSLGLEMNSFRPLWSEDMPAIEDVLRTIESRYLADGFSSFSLNDRTVMELLALKEMLNKGDVDGKTACILVSDIVRDLYLADAVDFLDPPGTEKTCPEDVLYSRIMSDLSVAPDLDASCKELGLDEYAICRRFKSAYGRPPYSEQKHWRLLTAAASIILGEKNMTKVARSCGYTAETKFADAFRKEFGCRPKHLCEAYRIPTVGPNPDG